MNEHFIQSSKEVILIIMRNNTFSLLNISIFSQIEENQLKE